MYFSQKFIKKVNANFEGRDFLIGDLHGCFDELIKLLHFVKFDPSRDRLFSTGDLIDRGPKSYDCLALTKKEWFHPVLGNHEDLLMNKLKSIQNDDIKSFSIEDMNYINKLSNLTSEIIKMPLVIEIEHLLLSNVFITHSEILPEHIFNFKVDDIGSTEYDKVFNRLKTHDYSKEILKFFHGNKEKVISNDLKQKLLWSRKIINSFYKDNKNDILKRDFTFIEKNKIKQNMQLFCGHNVVPYPMKIGQQYYLDTGAALGYSNKDTGSSLFEAMGHEFFTLSMVELYTGACYGCITSPKDRGKILKFEKSIYD
jgi:hypothetical protein